MDALLPVNRGYARLRAEDVRRYYDNYLYRDPRAREHVTVVFRDIALPAALIEGIEALERTKVVWVDMRRSSDQSAVVRELWDPEKRYVSIHDFTAESFPTAGQKASQFAEVGRGIDYTSFEFPRFDRTPEQVEHLLAVVMAGEQAEEVRRADRFFELLRLPLADGSTSGYEISIRSGPSSTRELFVRGRSPWMELCGPLVEGEIRFSPGCELFYAGADVDGVLHCRDGINFLPLRGAELDVPQCRRIVELGARLAEDPVEIHVREGRIVGMSSAGGLASAFQEVFAHDEAFSWVVEVGIGLRDAARPLVTEWAASSNEAIPGVHVGIGADPSKPSRFRTKLHLDFVVPDAVIGVNGKRFYGGAQFAP